MFKLPDYEVVIHIKLSKFSVSLEKEIESLSVTFDLDESTEYNGIRDYHWAFGTWEEAVAAGEKFKHMIQNPNILMLRVKSNYDPKTQSITHKDLVRSSAPNPSFKRDA